MSDIDQLKALVRAYLQAQEDIAECQDRRGLLCDEPECEDCEIQEMMLDARLELRAWMRNAGACSGCGCPEERCEGYRGQGKKCCPDCEHDSPTGA